MAQADSQNSTAIGGATALPVSSAQTRRGILKAVAAAPVVALVPAIPAFARGENSASEPFATLGEKFQMEWAAYASNRPIYEKAHDRANGLLYDALISAPHKLDINDCSDKGEYWALAEHAQLQTEFKKAETIEEATYEALYETSQLIVGLQPTAIGDLAVLANVCAYTSPHLWDEPAENLDWEAKYFRLLVEQVLRLAGTKLILEGLPIPQIVDQSAHQRAHEFWEAKGIDDLHKQKIYEAYLKYEGDPENDPWFKVYHSTAARVSPCSENDFLTVLRWARDKNARGV